MIDPIQKVSDWAAKHYSPSYIELYELTRDIANYTEQVKNEAVAGLETALNIAEQLIADKDYCISQYSEIIEKLGKEKKALIEGQSELYVQLQKSKIDPDILKHFNDGELAKIARGG